MPRIALIQNGSCTPHIVTDCVDLEVYSIDDSVPNDRVYQMGPSIRRVTGDEFDALLGDDTIHHYGDKPNVEQAMRAMLNLDAGGKPSLAIVEDAQ